MFQEKTQVLWNTNMGPSYHNIGIRCHEGYSQARPGQFVTLRFGEQIAPLLRRPFSIHRLITVNGRTEGFELLYKVVGPCTKMLSTYKAGDVIDVLGPLGNCFSVPGNMHRIFICGGGIGIAPMVFLAFSLQEKGFDLSQCMVFIGGRSANDLLCQDDFLSLGMPVSVTTEDGTAGGKGFVTDALENNLRKNRPAMIYTCGPMGMLRAVAQIAETHAVPCQISIETLMACGMGACLGCAVENKDDPAKYLHVCADGPVFDTSVLKF